ncbi:MAG: hypothetical protein ACLR6J_14035 [Parabacteroides merdae]
MASPATKRRGIAWWGSARSIAKNRNGSTGIARFRYNPSFTRITDYIQPGTQTSFRVMTKQEIQELKASRPIRR